MRSIFCVECDGEIKCSLIKGHIAYPRRKDLYHKNFWQCNLCGNFVGTHNKGEGLKPLGCIPNQHMKRLRIQIHSVLDPIWKNKKMSRSEVYKIISDKIGYEYHTAEIRKISEAQKVYEIVKELK